MSENDLVARLKASVAAYNAMPPIERAIHDLEQRRSGARGLAKMSTPNEVIDAHLGKRPEYVILAAYCELEAQISTLAAREAAAVGALEEIAKWSEHNLDKRGTLDLIGAHARTTLANISPQAEAMLKVVEAAQKWQGHNHELRRAVDEYKALLTGDGK